MTGGRLLDLMLSRWAWLGAIVAPLIVFGGAVVLTLGAAGSKAWIICAGAGEILIGLGLYLAPQVVMLINDGDI